MTQSEVQRNTIQNLKRESAETLTLVMVLKYFKRQGLLKPPQWPLASPNKPYHINTGFIK